MFVFLRDMVIGWVIFTPEGKKVANNVMSFAYKKIKKNISNSKQYKEIIGLKDIFINNESEEVDEPIRYNKINHRPKN